MPFLKGKDQNICLSKVCCWNTFCRSVLLRIFTAGYIHLKPLALVNPEYQAILNSGAMFIAAKENLYTSNYFIFSLLCDVLLIAGLTILVKFYRSAACNKIYNTDQIVF